MFNYSWDEFWWRNITGPHVVVTKVSEALLDNHMVVLSVPTDLPWRHAMRGTIQTAFRDRLGVSDVVIEPIDVVDDNPEGIEPGRFILSRFASSTISRGYREKSKVTIQEYITAKKVIKNRIIWVKGLRGAVAEQWIKFCRDFSYRVVQDGLFVLEIQGEIRLTELKPLERVNFNDLSLVMMYSSSIVSFLMIRISILTCGKNILQLLRLQYVIRMQRYQLNY